MSGWERDISDAFLEDIEDVEALVEGLPAATQSPEARIKQALLAAATLEGRFDRFAEITARLLDVDEARAKATLNRIDQADLWYQSALPDMSLVDLDGGPAVSKAITGFVRLPAGTHFPLHEHAGEENVFVIQGSLEDGPTGRVFRAGEVATMAEGTQHDFHVRPGPDLVYLLVVQNGVKIGDTFYAYDDPRV